MPTLQLAANLIASTSTFGLNWGHLQIVHGSEEIEVQAPGIGDLPADIWATGSANFSFQQLRDHDNSTDFSPGTGYDGAKYEIVGLDVGDRNPDEVWNLLQSINSVFFQATGSFNYSLGQNSNSYVTTLLWMVGIDVTSYIAAVTPEGVNGPTTVATASGYVAATFGPILGLDPNFHVNFPGLSNNLLTNGSAFDISLSGTTDNDFFRTGDGNDLFSGLAGDDEFHAGGGDDTFVGGTGSDIFDGESDYDIADYSGSVGETDEDIVAGIDARIGNSTNDELLSLVSDSWGEIDTLINIEEIVGTSFDDVVALDGQYTEIVQNLAILNLGEEGELGDTLDLSNTETVDGLFVSLEDEFVDIGVSYTFATGISIQDFENVVGTNQNDTISGNSEDNTIEGNGGIDIIESGAGNDSIYGGSGDDTLTSGESSGEGGSSTEEESSATFFGGGDDDTVQVINGDGVAFGGSGNDELDAREAGDDANVFLSGGSGNDTLYGSGDSVLSGGSGEDEFHIQAGDTISDSEGHDKLFYNGTEVTDSGSVIYGLEFGGASGNRDYVAVQQNGESVYYNDAPAVNASIGIVFVATGLAPDFDGTTTSILYDMYIFEDVSFGPAATGTTGIDPNFVFNLSEATAVITDFRQGDFGLFADGDIAFGYGNLLHNSTGAINRLGISGDSEIGTPHQISDEELARETDFEELTEADEEEADSPEDDNIQGGDDDVAYVGGAGNDQIRFGDGNDSGTGDAGNDILLGEGGDDTLAGGEGDDVLYGDSFTFTVAGGSPAVDPDGDIFDPDTGDDGPNPIGDDGLDIFGNDTRSGGRGDNFPIDGEGDDFPYEGGNEGHTNNGDPNFGVGGLNGIAGDDVIDAGAGDDRAYGGDGNDLISGGTGIDILNGENGNDTIDGGSGADSLNGGNDDDSLSGGAGNDSITGGAGDDILLGEVGNDTLNGNAGNDTLVGGEGNDSLSGGEGADLVSGGVGDDTINGDSGSDVLVGNDGIDSISGADGDDEIRGGFGDDILEGGVGDDSYYYASGDGSDIIFDTGPNGYRDTDRIVFEDLNSSEITFSREADNLILTLQDGNTITLREQFRLGNAEIELAEFSDGEVLDISVAALGQFGTSENDTLTGSFQDEKIFGFAGDDHLSGFFGDDELDGGADNDVLVGAGGNDTLIGGTGDDTLIGGDDENHLDGGEGQDTAVFAHDVGDYDISEENGTFSLNRTGTDESHIVTGTEFFEFDDITLSLEQLLHAAVPETDEPITLAIDGDLSEAYGNRFLGLSDDDGIVWFAFEGGAGDLNLALNGYGISFDNEVEVFLNGTSLGHLAGTANQGFGASEFQILASQQNLGANSLEFHQTLDVGYIWGVDEVSLTAVITGPPIIEGTTAGDVIDLNYTGDAEGDVITTGADTIEGGLGNDALSGRAGNDTYNFAIGDGNDTVTDRGSHHDQADRLVFEGRDFDLSYFSREFRQSGLSIDFGNGDSVTVNSQSNNYNRIEFFEFEDQIVSSSDLELQMQVAAQTDGDDQIMGTTADDANLRGGLGDDALSGGTGNDTFNFAIGDGQDTITDSGSHRDRADRLVFEGRDFDLSYFSREFRQSTLNIDFGDGDGVTVNYQNNSYNRVDFFEFNDLTVSADQLEHQMQLAAQTDGDDQIMGVVGQDDELRGGLGNDALSGASGGDTYYFAIGDGHDTITDGGSHHDTADRLVIEGRDFDLSYFATSSPGSALSFDFGNGDSVTINSQNNNYNRVEIFEFDDQTLTYGEITDLWV